MHFKCSWSVWRSAADHFHVTTHVYSRSKRRNIVTLWFSRSWSSGAQLPDCEKKKKSNINRYHGQLLCVAIATISTCLCQRLVTYWTRKQPLKALSRVPFFHHSCQCSFCCSYITNDVLWSVCEFVFCPAFRWFVSFLGTKKKGWLMKVNSVFWMVRSTASVLSTFLSFCDVVIKPSWRSSVSGWPPALFSWPCAFFALWAAKNFCWFCCFLNHAFLTYRSVVKKHLLLHCSRDAILANSSGWLVCPEADLSAWKFVFCFVSKSSHFLSTSPLLGAICLSTTLQPFSSFFHCFHLFCKFCTISACPIGMTILLSHRPWLENRTWKELVTQNGQFFFYRRDTHPSFFVQTMHKLPPSFPT